MEKKVAVLKVLTDDEGNVIWVHVQYVKEEDGLKIEILHDAVFARGQNGRVFLLEKRIENYIPPKRYEKMIKTAAAIIHGEKRAPKTIEKPA